MSNYLLKPVFRAVFGEDFNPESFEERLKMQKMVYILQNKGISVGDYGFKWYKHGPYSQALQNDILTISQTEDTPVRFSPDAERTIESLKKAIFDEKVTYPTERWIECLGSLLYIKENLVSIFATDDDLIEELNTRKPALDKIDQNRYALQVLDNIS